MGYMGFGMRKEDYQRKPKEVFSKIKAYQNFKKHTTQNPEKHHTNVAVEKFVRYNSYQHFYETKFFKAIFIIILLFVVIFVIYILKQRLF